MSADIFGVLLLIFNQSSFPGNFNDIARKLMESSRWASRSAHGRSCSMSQHSPFALALYASRWHRVIHYLSETRCCPGPAAASQARVHLCICEEEGAWAKQWSLEPQVQEPQDLCEVLFCGVRRGVVSFCQKVEGPLPRRWAISEMKWKHSSSIL